MTRPCLGAVPSRMPNSGECEYSGVPAYLTLCCTRSTCVPLACLLKPFGSEFSTLGAPVLGRAVGPFRLAEFCWACHWAPSGLASSLHSFGMLLLRPLGGGSCTQAAPALRRAVLLFRRAKLCWTCLGHRSRHAIGHALCALWFLPLGTPFVQALAYGQTFCGPSGGSVFIGVCTISLHSRVHRAP